MIYLDNAATTFPKPAGVKKAISDCIGNWCANPGRSGHKYAMKSAEAVYEVRKKIGKFTGFEPDEVMFTHNCTSALNVGIRGVLEPGDHVVSTVFEHNSVLRTLNALRVRGIETTLVGSDNRGVIDPASFRKAIKKNTKMIICTLASNVTGNIMPVEEIQKEAASRNILFMLDGSQGLGSIPLDFEKFRPDIICCSGHKSMMGPQGTGFICARKEVRMKPLLQGGTGTQSEMLRHPEDRPEGFEAGTLNVPGIVGLGAGVDYILERGVNDIRKLEADIIGCLQEELKSIEKIVMYGDENPENRCGILSFNIEEMDSEKVAAEMDETFGIATRAGFHCAPLAHASIGTKGRGCVRISIGPFTTYEDILKTAAAIRKISAKR